MEKPLCRLCKERHLASEPHRWSKEADAPKAAPPAKPKAAPLHPEAGAPDATPEEIARALRFYRKHRERQREVMRKRRAKGKK